MKRSTMGCGCFTIIVFVLLLAPLLAVFIEIPLYLLFGWIGFLKNIPSEMTIEPAAIVVGVTALVLLVPVTHGLASWLYGQVPIVPTDSQRWRLRWSVSIVAIVVLLFASGISILVTIHETGWLFTSKKPIIESGGARQAARRMTSMNNLKQIGLAFHNYHDNNAQFPPGGTFNEYGEMQHSWETALLPYMEHGDLKPDLTLPWNHPQNTDCVKTRIGDFLNPGIGGDAKDAHGYALSHYAANSHVLGPNRGIRIGEVTDGTSNTIMAGEVKENFKPWAYPVNWRDPSLGTNRSPDGFGAPWPTVVYFLMIDGSVRPVANDVDPAVLRAMATPAGGEKIKDDY